MASTVHSKFAMSREFFSYLKHRLTPFVDCVTVKRSSSQVKQDITHPNLSLESSQTTSIKHSIFASSQSGFNALRTVFSSNLGIGVRKQHPPLHTIGDHLRNPAALQLHDSINICDVDLSNSIESNTKNWLTKMDCLIFMHLQTGRILYAWCTTHDLVNVECPSGVSH